MIGNPCQVMFFYLGSGPIPWVSKKKTFVALSSTEAEYRITQGAMCKAIRLYHIMADLDIPKEKPPVLYCDNQGVLKHVKNLVFHEHTKHIEVKCHYIWDQFLNHHIEL